jgi:hypothetical protein
MVQVKRIALRNNFIVSQDGSKWLGNGAYFFVKGISQ